MDKVQHITNSVMGSEQKQSAAEPYLQQIQQLQELMTAERKKA